MNKTNQAMCGDVGSRDRHNPGGPWLASLAQLVNAKLVRDSILKNKIDGS